MKNQHSKKQFAVCIANDGCEDLEFRKIYRVLPDEKAAEVDYIRVIDESDEDYLYSAEMFFLI